jgi:hypothetical protein
MKKNLLLQEMVLNLVIEEDGVSTVRPNEPLPNEPWITSGELPDLEVFQKAGGHFFFRSTPEKKEVSGGFRISSSGMPIQFLDGNISRTPSSLFGFTAARRGLATEVQHSIL